MEVLHKGHVTTRDRTVVHKGLVSTRTRTAHGPAQSAAFRRRCSLLHQVSCYPCRHFKTAPTASLLAQRPCGPPLPCHAASPELVLPQTLAGKLSTAGVALEVSSCRSSVCKRCVSTLTHVPLTGTQATTTISLLTGAPAGCNQARFAAVPRQANPCTCSSRMLKMGF